MQPNIQVSVLSIAVATIVAFVFAFLWYGPIFGKTWAKLHKFSMDKKPDPKEMMKFMAINILGCFFMVYIMSYFTALWRPSVWGVGSDMPSYTYGVCTAVMVWFGFYVPMLFNKCTWEGKTWKLFILDGAYSILNLIIIGLIVSCVH